MQKKKKASSEVARLPAGFRDRADESNFMSDEELLGYLTRTGYNVSVGLFHDMKTPKFLCRGKFERCEFFDCASSPQPFPFHVSDSPADCLSKNGPPPAWIKEWYLAIIEENGEKFIILIFRPRDMFVKCPLSQAESVIPEEMRSRAMNPEK